MTFLSLLLISAGMWTVAFGIGLNDLWLCVSGFFAVCAGCGLLWLVNRIRSRPAQLEERDWDWPVWSSDGRDGRTLRRAEAYRRHYFDDGEDKAA